MVLLFYSTGMRSVGWVGVIFWPSSYLICVSVRVYVSLCMSIYYHYQLHVWLVCPKWDDIEVFKDSYMVLAWKCLFRRHGVIYLPWWLATRLSLNLHISHQWFLMRLQMNYISTTAKSDDYPTIKQPSLTALGSRPDCFLLTQRSWHQHVVCLAGQIAMRHIWCSLNLIQCILLWSLHFWLHDCIFYIILQALMFLGNWLFNASLNYINHTDT